jgi:Transposase DDE domain
MGHKRDWKQYNKQLVNRGKINFWIDPQVLKTWKAARKKKNGRPFAYSDALIEMMCTIRFKFHLSLRETEGFFHSLTALMRLIFKVPSYTQVCRRMKNLPIPTDLLVKKNITDIVLDTTGLKVYGEGEWRAEKYGGKRAWKKLHLALDPDSGKLVLAEITDEYVHDTTYLEKSLQKVNGRKGRVFIDGIADGLRCYRLAQKYNKELLTPPKRGAIIRREEGFERRNDAVRVIRGLGNDRLARSIWGKLVGYNRRVVVESMMSRWKRIYGADLKSRCVKRQGIEVQLKATMINEMIHAMG